MPSPFKLLRSCLPGAAHFQGCVCLMYQLAFVAYPPAFPLSIPCPTGPIPYH